MTMIQTILLFAVLAIWLCISAVILISSIQSFLYDRRREKRERERWRNKVPSPRAAERSAALLGYGRK